MANKKASEKSIRQTSKRTARNKSVRSELKTLARKVRELTASGSELLKDAAINYASAMDKAAKRGIIHHNKASRHKSRLSKVAGI